MPESQPRSAPPLGSLAHENRRGTAVGDVFVTNMAVEEEDAGFFAPIGELTSLWHAEVA